MTIFLLLFGFDVTYTYYYPPKLPKYISEYESTYQCSKRDASIQRLFLYEICSLMGIQYELFGDPWEECKVYSRQILVLNPEFGKVRLPDKSVLFDMACEYSFLLFNLQLYLFYFFLYSVNAFFDPFIFICT